MAATATPYNHLWLCLLNGTIIPATDTIKLMLLSSAYTPDAEHEVLASVSGSQITGTGYTAGGHALTGVTAARSGSLAALDAADLTFSGLTATFRRGVLYAAVTRNGKVNPLIGHVLFDSTPADVSVAGIDYPVVWNSSGILTLGPAA